MRIRKSLVAPTPYAALWLGQASAAWGGLVAIAYWLGFALLVPQSARAGLPGTLSLTPPVLGLALGSLALCLARRNRSGEVGPALVGLVLSGLAFGLALSLRLVR